MDDPGIFGRSSIQAISTAYDPENLRVAWKTNMPLPEWLFKAERWQELTGVGEGKTQYETFEVFYGPVSLLVKFWQLYTRFLHSEMLFFRGHLPGLG